MLALYEYRSSAYANDPEYRKAAHEDRLLHLTLVEEAHNVLAKPPESAAGSGNPQQAAANLFSNMLAEIREYGQGLMVVDQIPTKLIPEVIKNTNYKIVHRLVAPDDYGLMASSIALRDDQRSIIPALVPTVGSIDDGSSYANAFVSRFSGFRSWDDTQYLSSAQLILKGIFQAGVVRDSFPDVVVDENTVLYYSTLDGRPLAEGETVQVLMPCWHKDGTVLEKGILK